MSGLDQLPFTILLWVTTTSDNVNSVYSSAQSAATVALEPEKCIVEPKSSSPSVLTHSPSNSVVYTSSSPDPDPTVATGCAVTNPPLSEVSDADEPLRLPEAVFVGGLFLPAASLQAPTHSTYLRM